MTTFMDIFKKRFLEMASMQDVTINRVIISLSIAMICGFIIFFFYQKFYRGVIYSHNFNILLVMISMVTTLIIITISSNIVLSLGMVGALSIVRFRTAIKDPLDIGFLFWAVAEGITVGANLYSLAIVSTIFIGLLYAGLTKMKSKKKLYLLIIQYEDNISHKVNEIISQMKYTLKNKTSTKGRTELTLELMIKGDHTGFVGQLSSIEGVDSAVLVQYAGDYAGEMY